MKQIQFKTNIHCHNCMRAVSGFLNDVGGIDHWQVDVDHPDKILTVKGEKVNVDAVIEAVEEAGFEIAAVSQG